MYIINDMVYSDPGYMLQGSKRIGYQFKGSASDFVEVPVRLDDIVKNGNVLKYNNNNSKEIITAETTYPYLKGKFVKVRYSNDDQIAIMLNKDNSEDDKIKFDRMQAWRDWSGQVAKALINVIENE